MLHCTNRRWAAVAGRTARAAVTLLIIYDSAFWGVSSPGFQDNSNPADRVEWESRYGKGVTLAEIGCNRVRARTAESRNTGIENATDFPASGSQRRGCRFGRGGLNGDCAVTLA